MSDALKVSSDIFFFKLGAQANDKGRVIQRWAEQARLRPQDGHRPARRGARAWCPTASGASAGFAKYDACVHKDHADRADDRRAVRSAAASSAPWTGGDNVNLAVGQGDLQATPLQVAVAYSALANGGTIVTPHLGKAIEDGNGVTIQELRSKPQAQDQDRRARPRRSCSTACIAPPTRTAGTSADVFKGWPKELTVYGKTGTAEREPEPRPGVVRLLRRRTPARPIVVVVTVEKGGFGADTAAPAARLILSQWFDVGDREFHAGTSATR